MSEAVVTTQDYVRAAIAGDALKAQEIFQQLMGPKIVDAVDQKRTEIAQNYFGQQPQADVDVPEVEDSAEVQDTSSENDTGDEQLTATDTEEESNENA